MQLSLPCIANFALADSSLSLLEFRTNGILASNETGETYSGQLSWNPSYALQEKLALRGNIGASAFKGAFENFMVMDFGALASYSVMPELEAELGAGIQNWSSRGTWLLATGNMAWKFENRIFGLVDRAFVGYSRLFQDSASNEFRLGIGISLSSFGKGASDEQK